MICGNCQREITEYSNFCYYCGARQGVTAQPSGPAAPPKRLMRSTRDSKIAGVCGGLAEYMDADSTVVRLIWALLTFCTGIVPGFLTYIVAWIIMPLAPVYVAAPASAPPQNVAQPAPRAS
jgi:phage shock protein C